MVVRFAVTNEWTEINSMWEGRFMERNAPGAFRKTIRENRERMRVTFNHGGDPSIGDKVLGPISDLREEEDGSPVAEVPLFDTSYNRDLLPGLEADQYGASYRFQVMREEWVDSPEPSDYNPEGLPERTVKEARVLEFGPVTYPAYAGASAGVRSLTDEYMVGRFVSEPARLRELIEKGVPERSHPHPEDEPDDDQGDIAPSTPTPAAATSDKERREQAPVEEASKESTTVDANTDIDRFTSVEMLAERQREIAERHKYLAAEYGTRDFDPETQAEWDALEDEDRAITARLETLAKRQAVLERKAAQSESREHGTAPATFNAPRQKVEHVYDLSEYRKAASNPQEEARLLLEGAKRSIETTDIPLKPEVARETKQEKAQDTLERLDRGGALATYLLAVGSPTYRRAFGKFADSAPVAAMFSPEESNAVQQAKYAAERAFSLGTTGIPIPYQLDPTVIPISNSSVNPYRAISRVVQTTVNEWRGATSAGITAAYAAEGTEASDNTPTLAQPTISAVRAQAFVPFSIESGQDWPELEAEMGREVADAKDDLEATKFTLGSGTNEPFGLITGATTLVITTTTGAFVAADTFKLEEALPPRFRPRASMVANRFILNKVRQFDTSGGATNWLPYPGLGQGLNNQVPTPGNVGYGILAYPTYEVSAMDAALTTGSEIIVMGDFRYFVIVDRVGMSADLVPHLVGTNHRPTGQRGLYYFWRNGSKVVNAAAFRTLQT